ncbi:MAG: hypothetical protein ACRDPW_00995, partial [Mycobacteriales bacterium]
MIANPDGEQYVVGNEKFTNRYAPTDKPGRFRSTGTIRAIENPTGAAVVVAASWGEDQLGGGDCMLATLLDADGTPANDRYLIGRAEFNNTYELLNPRIDPPLRQTPEKTSPGRPAPNSPS